MTVVALLFLSCVCDSVIYTTLCSVQSFALHSVCVCMEDPVIRCEDGLVWTVIVVLADETARESFAAAARCACGLTTLWRERDGRLLV